MTNTLTDSEKVRSLQIDVLYLKAMHADSPTTRFVALSAFSSEDPILTLQQLARRKHASLPDVGGEWIRKKASQLLGQLYEKEG